MIKLKNILFEQGAVKTFVIQTPAPKSALDIVRSTKPRGAAFILKSTDVLGEEPSMDMIISLLKLDAQFGEQSVWATSELIRDNYTDSFIYLIGPDLKDAQRKTKFVVMIVPKSYIVDQVLGPNETDTTKKQAVYEELVTTNLIGNASVMMQSEFDALKTKIAPLLDKERIKKLEAELAKAKQALSTPTEPPVQKQTVITTEPEQDTTQLNKIESLKKRLQAEPIKLNTKSDDVAYIQDLIYRIGMADSNLGETNNVPTWAAFRDAKAQFGTYGPRTKNFIDVVKQSAELPISNSDITAEILQLFLDAGKPLNITESRIKLKNLIVEQFVIKPEFKTTQTQQQEKPQQQDKTKNDKKLVPEPEKQDKKLVKKDDTKKDRSELVTNQSNLVKGKLSGKYKLKIKLDPDGLAFREFSIPSGSDLIFNPATKTWLIYPKTNNYGYHIFKYKMGSNEFSYYGKGSWMERARWQLSSLSKWLNSDKFVEHLKSVYTTKDPVLQEELNLCLRIAKDLRLVTTVNPNKYFWKFRSTTNDNEAGAAAWFANAWNKAWAVDLKKLSGSNSNIIRINAQSINNFATGVYDSIKSGYRYSGTIPIINPENKKATNFVIDWNYM